MVFLIDQPISFCKFTNNICILRGNAKFEACYKYFLQ